MSDLAATPCWLWASIYSPLAFCEFGYFRRAHKYSGIGTLVLGFLVPIAHAHGDRSRDKSKVKRGNLENISFSAPFRTSERTLICLQIEPRKVFLTMSVSL